MQATVHDLDDFTQRVSFDFSADHIKGLFDAEMQKIKRQIKMPGFRKGKVPHKMITRQYGPGVLMDLQQDLVQKAWTHVVTELKLEPMSQPELEDLSGAVSTTKGFNFKFSFETLPPFELLDDTSFELTRTEWTTSEEALQARLDELCAQMGEWGPLKRRKKAREGDQIVFSLKAFDGEEEMTALASDEERVELGSKTMIPELESAFEGLKVEEEAKVDYTFPEEHPNEELKGKAITFVCVVKEVNEKTSLKLEELAEKLEAEDVDALKAKLSEEMATERNQAEAQKMRSELAKQLRERYDFAVPPTALNEQTHHRLHSEHKHAEGEACEHSAEDEEAARLEAARDLRMEAVLRRLAQTREVEVSDKEVNDRIFEMLRGAGEFGFQLFQFYQEPKNKARLKESLAEDKILDKIIEGASVKVTQDEIKPEANEEA